jgi:hypothetical protein
MSRAIFQSTGQALHFAYLIQSFEAAPESVMAKEMRKHLAMLGETERRSTVDFGGLNPLEIRGQMAMVRSAVNSRLPKPEADAIKARYGLVMTSKLPDGTGSAEISEERRLAIIELAEYLHPQFDNVPRLALVWLISRAVGNVASMRPAFKTIATMFGGSAATMCRVNPKLLVRLAQLERAGIDRLTPVFEREGLVAEACYG